jgi:hypothetical protein
MIARRSATGNGIPLYLILDGIARRIKMQGDEVLRISVKRTHWHHYTISVRTKSLPGELRVPDERVRPSEDNPDDLKDDVHRDGDSGGAT